MRNSAFASIFSTLLWVAAGAAAHADTSSDAAAAVEPHLGVPLLTLVLAGGLPLLLIAGLGSLLIARRTSRAQARPATQVPMADPVSRRQITEIREPAATLEEIGPNPLSHRLDGSMIRIGRHAENDVQLASQTVHRYHAVLHVTPRQGYVLTDLSGPDGNGVLVNEAHVEHAELKSGDLIELGDVKLRFRMGTDAHAL